VSSVNASGSESGSESGSTVGLRSLLAWAVVALVAWQGLAVAVSIVSEVTHLPLAKQLEPLRSSPEDLVRASLGRDFGMWAALQEYVPPGTEVLVARTIDDVEIKKLLTRLWALSYPITFRARPYSMARPPAGAPGQTDWQGYLLEIGLEGEFPDWPDGRVLARGERFRLSRFGEDER